jgi:uncharacterized protein YjbI with pentapeptide repeats
MREIEGDRDTQLGQRQVDVYAGLNVMILLLELHRYAQERDELREAIVFKPSSKNHSKHQENSSLLQTVDYSHCIHNGAFRKIVGQFLSNTNLSDADLNRVNLKQVNLNRANLIRANLIEADLVGVNLINAKLDEIDLSRARLCIADLSGASLNHSLLIDTDLTRANLSDADLHNVDLCGANLHGANLSRANLSNADLDSIFWTKYTNWKDVRGLETAINVPEELKRQLGLVENDD